MFENDYLQTLLQLNQSSPQFPGQLLDILDSREFDERVSNLPNYDLAEVIEHLDNVLDDMRPESNVFIRTLCELQKICASRMLLPSSHVLTDNVLDIDESPFSSGGFSDVFEGTYRGRKVCIKRPRVVSAENSEEITKGALMWKRLIHPNIVPFRGVTIDPFQIVSEWISGGDLVTYVNLNPRTNRVTLLHGVAYGLSYLHACGVIHGDMKGTNILVDDRGCARITDFGLAQNQDTVGESSSTQGHTTRWTAPEVLNGGPFSKEADVFSFAMVMIEGFTGTVPFNQHTSVVALMNVLRGRRPPRPVHPDLTNELWRLIQQCWDQNPYKRPQMSEVSAKLCFPQSPLTPLRSGTPNPSNANSHRSIYGRIAQTMMQPLVAPRAQALASDAQRRLEILDPSDEKYRPLLHALLSYQDPKPHSRGLQGSGLQGFVELLDEALGHIPATDDLSREILHRLQSTCSNHGILPRSHVVGSEAITNRGEVIAYGAFVDVCEAELHGKRVRIKRLVPILQDTMGVLKKAFYREVVAWKRLQHPNIVPFLGVPAEVPPFEIIDDWMENGRIDEYVRNNPKVDRIDLLWDVADGLRYLHSRGIVHGDLNGATVLIDKDDRARLTDFGLISIISGKSPVLSSRDPSLTNMTWAAPEILKGGPVSEEGDVFTFAMVAVETFVGNSPFSNGYHAAVSDITVGKRPRRPEGLYHDGLWWMMERCWNQDPGERPTSSQLLEFFRTWFPRERGMEETQPLPSASSTRGLADAGCRLDGNARPYRDQPRRGLRDGGEPEGASQYRGRVTVLKEGPAQDHTRSSPRHRSPVFRLFRRKEKASLIS